MAPETTTTETGGAVEPCVAVQRGVLRPAGSGEVRRSALRWHGAKNRDARRIIALMPSHECYVEPFGGSAGVLLRKRPAPFEVYNDHDGRLVTFFRVLRTRRAELVEQIHHTPHARAEHDHALRTLGDPGAVQNLLDRGEELELARLVYVASWQTRHFPATHWRSGWRYEHSANRGKSVNREWNDTSHLDAVVWRLKQVQIECDDAPAVCRRYDRAGTLHYLDPPYPAGTRGDRWATQTYKGEMTDDDHRALAEVLHSLDGMVMLSGYACPLYDEELYPDWHRVTWDARTDAGLERTEVLWLNDAAHRGGQGPLFSAA